MYENIIEMKNDKKKIGCTLKRKKKDFIIPWLLYVVNVFGLERQQAKAILMTQQQP